MDFHTKLRENHSYNNTSQPISMHLQENYLRHHDMKLDDDHDHQISFGVTNPNSSQGNFLQDFNINHIDHHQFHPNGPSSSSKNIIAPVFGVENLGFDGFDDSFEVYECKPFVDENFQYGGNFSCLNLPQRNHQVENINMNQSYEAFHSQETKPVDFVMPDDEVSCILSPSSVNYTKRTDFSYMRNKRKSFKVRKKSNMVKGQWTIEEDRYSYIYVYVKF